MFFVTHHFYSLNRCGTRYVPQDGEDFRTMLKSFQIQAVVISFKQSHIGLPLVIIFSGAGLHQTTCLECDLKSWNVKLQNGSSIKVESLSCSSSYSPWLGMWQVLRSQLNEKKSDLLDTLTSTLCPIRGSFNSAYKYTGHSFPAQENQPQRATFVLNVASCRL